MFCREVAILAKLNSPYVINFLGACLDDPSVSCFTFILILFQCLGNKQQKYFKCKMEGEKTN